MRRPSVLALILLAAAFAGCASDDPATTESAAAPAAPSAEATSALPDDAEAEPAASEPVGLTFSEQRRLEAGAQVCAPESASHCEVVGGAPFVSIGDWLDGPMLDLRAVVTWAPASAATDTLRVILGGCIGTEEDYECEHITSASGASPLEVAAESMATPWNYYFVLVTMPPSATEPHVRASPGQDVLVEGGLTWLRAPV